MCDIHISVVNANQVKEIQDFVLDFRKTLFPMLDPTKLPIDIVQFQTTYQENVDALFLQARDSTGLLVAVIGMMAYNRRFAYLPYPDTRAVEVARLFVLPDYRRSGLASMLFQALEREALRYGIEMLYLHTHPFLIGAFEFWEQQGFQHVFTSIDNGFTTWHMEKSLK